jgi:hypothetical protein
MLTEEKNIICIISFSLLIKIDKACLGLPYLDLYRPTSTSIDAGNVLISKTLAYPITNVST